ncbi:MAG TPA: hypothetical protein VMS88_07660, partial [Terriglobales bacterium]|nr:hypothetical protein [Terriglobales bacterium]
NGEAIVGSRVGRYLDSLRARFPGPVVADMLCLLRIHLELSLGAKGILLARSAGVRIPVDEHLRASFEELRFLQRSIGPTGRLAIQPFLRTSSRDLWQLYTIGGEAASGAPARDAPRRARPGRKTQERRPIS